MATTGERKSEPGPLTGVVVPLVTPTREEGSVDLTALERLCTFLVESGVHGLFVTGTTGEFPLLTTAERESVLRVCVEVSARRIPVVAQVGSQSLHEALHLADHAARTGADAVAAVTPYYFGYDDQALYAYYHQLCDAIAPLPFFLYNIPQRTANALSRGLVERLVEAHGNVQGIKDSSADMRSMLDWIELRDAHERPFSVLIGDERLSMPFLEVGGDGVVAAAAGVFPELYVDYYSSSRLAEESEAFNDDYNIISALASIYFGARIDYIKEALRWRGIPVGRVRAPLVHGSEAELDSLRKYIETTLQGTRWESLLLQAGAI